MSEAISLELSIRGTAMAHAVAICQNRQELHLIPTAQAIHEFLVGGPASASAAEPAPENAARRGRPPKVAAPAPETAPAPVQTSPPAPIAAPAPSPSVPAGPTIVPPPTTATDAAHALTALAQAKGRGAAVAVLQQFGAANLGLVPSSKLAEFRAACVAATAQAAPQSGASDLLA